MSSSGHWWENLHLSSELPQYTGVTQYHPRAYSAGNIVAANHHLLDDFRKNNFDIRDLTYTYGLLLVGIAFLLGAFLACLLLPCIFVCARKAASHALLKRPTTNTMSPRAHKTILLVLALVSLATVTVFIGGLVKAGVELASIATRTKNVVESLQTVLAVPDLMRIDLNNAGSAFDNVHDGSEGCAHGDVVEAIDVEGLIQGLEEELASIVTSGLGELAANVDDITDWIPVTSGVALCIALPLITLCVVVIATYVVNGLVHRSTRSCAQNFSSFSSFSRPLSVFLAVVALAVAACAIALSAMLGDFCTDPNTYVVDLLQETDQSAVGSLLEYYAKDCSTTNGAIETISTAQNIARGFIDTSLPTLWEVTALCEGIAPSVRVFNASLKQVWSLLDKTGWLISCPNINGLYQSVVYDNLCDNLLGRGLLVLLVSCSLQAVLLLMLVLQWTRMLRQKEIPNNVPDTGRHLDAEEAYKPRGWRLPIDEDRGARTTAYSPRELSPMVRSPSRMVHPRGGISPSTRSPSSRGLSPTSMGRYDFFSQKKAVPIAPKLSPTLTPAGTLPISLKPVADVCPTRYRSNE